MSIAARVLDTASRVTDLNMKWSDLPDQSRAYANLTSLHLILEHSIYKERKPLDIDRLARVAPGLRRLETSVANLMPDPRLIDFIWKIVSRFPQLLHLVINKDSHYSSSPAQKDLFWQLFVATSEERGHNCNTIHLHFRRRDEIHVWL